MQRDFSAAPIARFQAAFSVIAAAIAVLFGASPSLAQVRPCCIGTSCTLRTQTACEDAGGDWLGGGSSCSPNPCNPSGRCCTNGACSVTTQSACGGFFTQGGSCSPNPCPSRCCATNGGCTLTTQETCTGTWSPGGSCSPNPCPQPVGRCCSAGECSSTTQAACGGTWSANGSCSPNNCPPANDGCPGTLLLTSMGEATATGSTLLATTTSGAGASCNNSIADVWFELAPDITGVYTATLCTSTPAWDSILSIHTACPGTAANQVAASTCNDDGCSGDPGLSAIVTPFTLSAGVHYWVRVAGYHTTTLGVPVRGNFVLRISTAGIGACCSADGANCVVTTDAACPDAWIAGSTCSVHRCPRPGSCCAAAGCTVTLEDACSGQWTSGNTCGGPGAYNFAPSSSSFEDLSATGVLLTTVSSCDDCAEPVAIPFTFNYLGTDFTTLSVSSNGFVQFGGADAAFNNAIIPSTAVPNNFVAPLWNDWDPAIGGDVYRHSDGAPGTRRLVISWQNVRRPNETGVASFEVILHENSNDLEFRYGAIPSEGLSNNYTVGYENQGGTEGNSIRGATLGQGNAALRLSHTNPCMPADAGACCCGATCTLVSAASCTGSNRAFVGSGTACSPFSATVPCCRADVNRSGGAPTVQDIFDFLAAYFAGDACADANDTGAASVQDIFDFLAAYFAGCD